MVVQRILSVGLRYEGRGGGREEGERRERENINYLYLLNEIKQEGTTNITRNNGCAKNFKCWPQV